MNTIRIGIPSIFFQTVPKNNPQRRLGQPPFLKMFLANHEPCLSPVEPIEVCLDFATERLSLKVIAGILGLVLIFTNFKDVRKAYINTKHNYPEMKINTLPFQKLFSWNKLPTSAAESVV